MVACRGRTRRGRPENPAPIAEVPPKRLDQLSARVRGRPLVSPIGGTEDIGFDKLPMDPGGGDLGAPLPPV